jgi:hypothetical protein
MWTAGDRKGLQWHDLKPGPGCKESRSQSLETEGRGGSKDVEKVGDSALEAQKL